MYGKPVGTGLTEGDLRFYVMIFYRINKMVHVRFEVFTAVTMKNGVFWVVTPCGSF
jgi:hypothetical protein